MAYDPVVSGTGFVPFLQPQDEKVPANKDPKIKYQAVAKDFISPTSYVRAVPAGSSDATIINAADFDQANGVKLSIISATDKSDGKSCDPTNLDPGNYSVNILGVSQQAGNPSSSVTANLTIDPNPASPSQTNPSQPVKATDTFYFKDSSQNGSDLTAKLTLSGNKGEKLSETDQTSLTSKVSSISGYSFSNKIVDKSGNIVASSLADLNKTQTYDNGDYYLIFTKSSSTSTTSKGGSGNGSKPSQPSQPTQPSQPSQPTQPSSTTPSSSGSSTPSSNPSSITSTSTSNPDPSTSNPTQSTSTTSVPTTTSQSSSSQSNPSSSTSTAVGSQTSVQPSASEISSGRIAAKRAAVYSIKKIKMYSSAKFNRGKWIAAYAKKPRIKRPMFVVINYARSASGALRYKVKDVNHHSKTDGKIGYITANFAYVRPVYYAKSHKYIRVINPQGITEYKKVNLTYKVGNHKKGKYLRIIGIRKHNLTTRFILTNGHYVTANRKLVIYASHK